MGQAVLARWMTVGLRDQSVTGQPTHTVHGHQAAEAVARAAAGMSAAGSRRPSTGLGAVEDPPRSWHCTSCCRSNGGMRPLVEVPIDNADPVNDLSAAGSKESGMPTDFSHVPIINVAQSD